MGDIFHEQADRDLFFSSFASDLGSQLDKLTIEYEAMENGTIPEEEEIVQEDSTDSITLESKVQNELLEKNQENGGQPKEKERHRTYTMTIQRAFSTVSLMTNFKSNFWKRKHGKNKKPEENVQRERRASTSSTPEKNNNHHDLPSIKINGESEGRATIYSTVPRPGKNVNRSRTMSPSKQRKGAAHEPEPLERTESGNVFVPPVIVNGKVMYEYQYVTPEASPIHKSAKLRRRNSLSRLLRIRKSPKKSPKKDKNASPIKDLYEKTVLTASNNDLSRVSPQKQSVEETTSSDAHKDTVTVPEAQAK